MLSSLNRKQILALRGPKRTSHADRPIAFWEERESRGDGSIASVSTILLAGAECRFACSMCDLWKDALNGKTPPGALVQQIDLAFSQVSVSDWVKLYNGSNFFDTTAVPAEDLVPIAQRCSLFERVIVENHPRLLRPSILSFRDRLRGRLEIAMGLETIKPGGLALLRKEATLDDYEAASEWLLNAGIDIRAFVMLQPPDTSPEEGVDWAVRSAIFAGDKGARHVSIIPARLGNGAMEWFADQGRFCPPSAMQLEKTLEQLLAKSRPFVATVDLWDWNHLQGHCSLCCEPRRLRLESMNLSQRVEAFHEDRLLSHCECHR